MPVQHSSLTLSRNDCATVAPTLAAFVLPSPTTLTTSILAGVTAFDPVCTPLCAQCTALLTLLLPDVAPNSALLLAYSPANLSLLPSNLARRLRDRTFGGKAADRQRTDGRGGDR